MKFTKKDIVNLLWQFNQLELEIIDDTLITKISVTNPNPKNTLLSFQFENKAYYALFDEELLPEKIHLANTIRRSAPNVGELDLLGVDKFKSKTVYLMLERINKWRLDVYLATNAAELSTPLLNRSGAQKLIAAGKVTVNGAVASSNSLMVGKIDQVSVQNNPQTVEKLDLPILYEDEDAIVIEKPAGILTHSKGEVIEEATLADFVKEHWNGAPEEANNRLGIVHRLDRGTSGILVSGRNPESVQKLQKQFAERKTKKTYFAVVNGTLQQNKAVIKLPIARNQNRPTTFLVSPEGREAETLYEVVRESKDGRYSLLRLTPKTGRTHQLRVHLSHIGHSIVGDPIYGVNPVKKHAKSGTPDLEPSPSRLMLHAAELEITIPNGERKTFVSKIPAEFKQYVD